MITPQLWATTRIALTGAIYIFIPALRQGSVLSYPTTKTNPNPSLSPSSARNPAMVRSPQLRGHANPESVKYPYSNRDKYTGRQNSWEASGLDTEPLPTTAEKDRQNTRSNHRSSKGRQSLRKPSATDSDYQVLQRQANVINNYHGPVYNFHGPTANIDRGLHRSSFPDPPTIEMTLPPRRGDAGRGWTFDVQFGKTERQDPNSESIRMHKTSRARASPSSNQASPQPTGMVNAPYSSPPDPDDYFTEIPGDEGPQFYESPRAMYDLENANEPRQSPAPQHVGYNHREYNSPLYRYPKNLGPSNPTRKRSQTPSGSRARRENTNSSQTYRRNNYYNQNVAGSRQNNSIRPQQPTPPPEQSGEEESDYDDNLETGTQYATDDEDAQETQSNGGRSARSSQPSRMTTPPEGSKQPPTRPRSAYHQRETGDGYRRSSPSAGQKSKTPPHSSPLRQTRPGLVPPLQFDGQENPPQPYVEDGSDDEESYVGTPIQQAMHGGSPASITRGSIGEHSSRSHGANNRRETGDGHRRPSPSAGRQLRTPPYPSPTQQIRPLSDQRKNTTSPKKQATPSHASAKNHPNAQPSASPLRRAVTPPEAIHAPRPVRQQKSDMLWNYDEEPLVNKVANEPDNQKGPGSTRPATPVAPIVLVRGGLIPNSSLDSMPDLEFAKRAGAKGRDTQ
ncbi:hypothetical protein C0993_011324 [Termitomyces sp. T159_Od127]|nr:hypothetical protein C0993_011324 [Termitomyces sp. T159_Od127]